MAARHRGKLQLLPTISLLTNFQHLCDKADSMYVMFCRSTFSSSGHSIKLCMLWTLPPTCTCPHSCAISLLTHCMTMTCYALQGITAHKMFSGSVQNMVHGLNHSTVLSHPQMMMLQGGSTSIHLGSTGVETLAPSLAAEACWRWPPELICPCPSGRQLSKKLQLQLQHQSAQFKHATSMQRPSALQSDHVDAAAPGGS